MTFIVDQRIEQSSFFLFDAPLSRVYLKNEANFPWVLLVPRVPDVSEIHHLSRDDAQQLMCEMSGVSQRVSAYFKADKINVGALGNIVQQLHIHVIARFKGDRLWPHSLWQMAAAEESTPYDDVNVQKLIHDLREWCVASTW